MRKNIFTTLAAAVSLLSVAQAQVTETPATLALEAGGNPAGFVQGANDQGIIFSTAAGGRGQLVEYSKIRGEGLDKVIRFSERAESLAQARALFAAGEFDAAAAAFGVVAQNYSIILASPKNFASEAMFYQLESIRRAGKYALLPPLIASAAAESIEKSLGEPFAGMFQFQKLYALLAEKNFDELASAIAAYEEPVVGEAKLLSAPNFKPLPATELADLSYLRGKVYEAAGEKGKALNDFYSAVTLAFGNDAISAKLAMGAAMVIQKSDPLLASENRLAIAEMQSLAYMFGKRFGTDGMPAAFKEYAVRPPMVRPPAPAPKEEPAAAESAPEAAPAEAGKAAPKEGAKGEKGKKKK